MQRQWYELVTTTFINEDKEEGKYTTLFTDTGTFEILKPLDEVMKDLDECKKNNKLFKYRKLKEFSKTMEHFWELVLDLNNTKILWYEEHHIIDDFKKAKELETNLE